MPYSGQSSGWYEEAAARPTGGCTSAARRAPRAVRLGRGWREERACSCFEFVDLQLELPFNFHRQLQLELQASGHGAGDRRDQPSCDLLGGSSDDVAAAGFDSPLARLHDNTYDADAGHAQPDASRERTAEHRDGWS